MKVRYSGIGGQAVMEGVMMKNDNRYAIAVRKSNGEIIVEKRPCKGKNERSFWFKVPFVRGILNFVDSLVTGMTALNFSSNVFVEEDEEEKRKLAQMSPEERAKKKKKDDAEMGVTFVISLILALGIFVVAPTLLTKVFENLGWSETTVAVMEGVIRVVIFLGYMILISFIKDIRRVYMYHGAEHKCINCIEHGMELNVENVKMSSRFHKRCGTSFLFFVVIISVILFIFVKVDSLALIWGLSKTLVKVVVRLLMVPVIAGISYELIRLAGMSDNWFTNILSAPGFLVQHLTVKEPDDKMIEVGIASVEAVFDWKKYIEEINNSGEK